MSNSFALFKEYYFEPLRQFLSEVAPLGDFGYPYGIFLSHPLPEYDKAAKKIFYVGRDTNGWGDYYEMMELYHQGKLMEYLDNQWPTSAEEMMGWGNRMAFWTVVFKLHIYLNHGVLLPRLQDYSEEQKKCLIGLGFGNMNCVEIKASLQREKVWKDIEEEKYWPFKEKSRRFDRLKDILDLYNPDYIFLFTWSDDSDYMQNVNLIEDPSMREEYWRCVYSIEGYKTKLIWTSHPTYFAWNITQDVNKVVKYLGDTALGL